jgi:hypothetical protein
VPNLSAGGEENHTQVGTCFSGVCASGPIRMLRVRMAGV